MPTTYLTLFSARLREVGTAPLMQLASDYSSDSPLVARPSGRSLSGALCISGFTVHGFREEPLLLE